MVSLRASVLLVLLYSWCCHFQPVVLADSAGTTTTSDRAALVLEEDTVWSTATLAKNSIALTKNVTLFPGVTLTIQGTNNGTTENMVADSSDNVQTVQFFEVVFFRNITITLHSGSHIRLFDVSFRAPPNTTGEGLGVETLGSTEDHQDGITVLAQRFRCQGLVRCFHVLAGTVEVYDGTFRIDGSGRYAWSAYKSRAERCTFYNLGASKGVPQSDRRTMMVALDFVDCKFVSVGKVRSPLAAGCDSCSIHAERTSFVGYQTALSASGGGGDEISNCTFVGNLYAFEGHDGGYLSRGFVSDSFFWRNGVGQSRHDATRNIYMENVVAYIGSRSIVDIMMYRNIVGVWFTSDEGNYESLSRNTHRTIANITFKENVVSSLHGAAFPPQDASVNFLGSLQYHINYTFVSAADLTSGVFWSNDGASATRTDAQVRTKIRDGYQEGGGPGFVMIDSSASPLTPYLHSMFPSADYSPPSLKEWTQKLELPDIDAFPSLPVPSSHCEESYQKRALPRELCTHNFSWWWDDDGTPQHEYSSQDDGKSFCIRGEADDPTLIATSTIVNIRQEAISCKELSLLSATALAMWCLSPDSNADMICQHTCCNVAAAESNDATASIQTVPEDHLHTTTLLSSMSSGQWWLFALCALLYQFAIHVMAYWYLRQKCCGRKHDYATPPDEGARELELTPHLSLT